MLIIGACQTVEKITTVKIEYVLPPFPLKKEIIFSENPNLKEYAEIIIYYDYLVQEWETWGNTIKRLLTYNKEQSIIE